MKPFNKQAANLKRNLRKKNMKPLLMVCMVGVLLSLTYKSVSNVKGVGNSVFKEGNRSRGARKMKGRRQGFSSYREGSGCNDSTYRTGFREGGDCGDGTSDPSCGFRNREGADGCDDPANC
jgi:hypothetical protein